MRSRRDFLKTGLGAVAGTGVFLSTPRRAYSQFETDPPSPAMEPFVDPLPIPPLMRPKRDSYSLPHGRRAIPYEVRMKEVFLKLHRDLRPTRVWGYEGYYPGPTFEVKRGVPVAVRWVNDLPNEHPLAASIDHTLHGAEHDLPEVRTVVHLHGAKSSPESDGHPEAWFTNGFHHKGPTFPGEIYYYGNDQEPTMLWYHDHTLGVTRLNVVLGLAGLYFIRDEAEHSLGLPCGPYEIPLVIQDKRFTADGSIFYPTVGVVPDAHPQWTADYFGDLALVNGKVHPFLEVEPRKYRFRILNAANSRTFNLQLPSGPSFIQIGADHGFLPAPVRTSNLLLQSAERADVIIDFSEHEGKEFVLTNDATHPYPVGFPAVPPFGPPQIMKFVVRKQRRGKDESKIPDSLPAPKALRESDSVGSRDIWLTEETVAIPGQQFPLPTLLLMEKLRYKDPVITRPKAGTVETWRFINAMPVDHPQHVHLARIQVIGRQKFDLEHYMMSGELHLGATSAPDPNELDAPKDTIRASAGSITTVLAEFSLPSEIKARKGDKFLYVHHCHMLEHEDNDMMRPFEVIG